MYKYYTKTFLSSEGIDEWLNSFYSNKPQSESNYEVVGYVSLNECIVITIRKWESFKENGR